LPFLCQNYYYKFTVPFPYHPITAKKNTPSFPTFAKPNKNNFPLTAPPLNGTKFKIPQILHLSPFMEKKKKTCYSNPSPFINSRKKPAPPTSMPFTLFMPQCFSHKMPQETKITNVKCLIKTFQKSNHQTNTTTKSLHKFIISNQYALPCQNNALLKTLPTKITK
jgi:hypothetical protein